MCIPGSGTEKPPGLGLGTGGRRDAGWPPLCAQGWLGVGRFGVICMCTRACVMREMCVFTLHGWVGSVCVYVSMSAGWWGVCSQDQMSLPRGLLWPEPWADSFLTLSAWDTAGCPPGWSSRGGETPWPSWWRSFSAVLWSHDPPSVCLQPSSVPSHLHHLYPFPREKG